MDPDGDSVIDAVFVDQITLVYPDCKWRGSSYSAAGKPESHSNQLERAALRTRNSHQRTRTVTSPSRQSNSRTAPFHLFVLIGRYSLYNISCFPYFYFISDPQNTWIMPGSCFEMRTDPVLCEPDRVLGSKIQILGILRLTCTGICWFEVCRWVLKQILPFKLFPEPYVSCPLRRYVFICLPSPN